MSTSAQVLAFASDVVYAAPAPGDEPAGGGGVSGIRGGFQDLWLAFSAALAIVAGVSRKLSVMGICLAAWLLGTAFAFTPESGMTSIGEGIGAIVGKIVETVNA